MDTEMNTSSDIVNEPPKRKSYPSDLTDEQWGLLEPLLVRAPGPGRPPTVDYREIVNTLFYMARTGVQWEFIPHDLAHPSNVRYYRDKWYEDGTWQKINDVLRQKVRQQAGRDPEPSLGIVDCQSVKTTETPGDRGYDGGKNIKGRKRHIVVDVMGLLLRAIVHPADIQEREGVEWLFAQLKGKFPRLRKILADQGYKGVAFIQRFKELFGLDLEISNKSPNQEGFVVQPKRWVVERSIAWFSRLRRLSKDYEATTEASESWIYLASIHLMLKRLCPDKSIRKPYAPSAKLALAA